MFEWKQFSDKAIKSIQESDSRINIWYGSVRSGKTISSIVRWLEYIEDGPEGELLMVGKTQRTLKRNILDTIQDIVGKSNFSFNRGMGEVEIFGRKIYVAGANDARAEGKIRGMTLAGAYCDEVTLYPEDFFTQLLARNSVKGAKIFCTTNPDSPYHWLKEKYIDRQDELDLTSFHFTLDDNLSLDETYKQELKKEYTGLWYKRFIEGRFVQAEGAIYDQYDDKKHTVDELPEMEKTWITCDYGTSNATVFLLIGLGADNKLYIIDEWSWGRKEQGISKSDSQLRKELQDFIRKHDIMPEWIFVDPSAASFITELYQYRNKFLPFKRVAKANNDVLDGIQKVSNLIGEDLLLVHNRCEDTKREFTSYVWDKKAQERGEDKPLKEYDHRMDALRYCVNGLGRIYEHIMKAGE